MTIIASFLASFITFIAAYNYLPLDLVSFNEGEKTFGATITTILGTDTLSASRTTINNNFTALNNFKIENSSSSIAAITTLSNLASIGTIATGVWNGTRIGGAYGGTGSTTLSSNQVMLGDGTSGLKTVAGWGVSGQFLTSGGAGNPPTWTTSSIDQAGNYTWTGAHRFSGAASSTLFGVLDTLYIGRTASTTIVGETTATSTFAGNIKVDGNATTTRLYTSNACIGCLASTTWATATAALSTSNGNQTSATASCASDEVATGGGVYTAAAGSQMVMESYPTGSRSWFGRVICNTSTGACGSGNLTVYAVCLKR